METIRFRQIGKQDIRFGSSSYRTVLADGSVVLLDEVPERIDIEAQANVEVTQEAVSYAIALSHTDTDYRLEVALNWNSRWWWSNKTATGITVNFEVPAPDGAKIDWAAYLVD